MSSRPIRKNEAHDNGPGKPYEWEGMQCHSHITSGRMFMATAINPRPHLGFGYVKGHVVYVWEQRNRFYRDGQLHEDETVYKVCRSDGRGPRTLTVEQAKQTLRARRNNKRQIIWVNDAEYTDISERRWFDSTR